jgi:hypothetical protein
LCLVILRMALHEVVCLPSLLCSPEAQHVTASSTYVGMPVSSRCSRIYMTSAHASSLCRAVRARPNLLCSAITAITAIKHARAGCIQTRR